MPWAAAPEEQEGRPGPLRAPPPRDLGDPIISAAVRADDVIWALFFLQKVVIN